MEDAPTQHAHHPQHAQHQQVSQSQQEMAHHRLNRSYQVIYNYLACAEQQVYARPLQGGMWGRSSPPSREPSPPGATSHATTHAPPDQPGPRATRHAPRPAPSSTSPNPQHASPATAQQPQSEEEEEDDDDAGAGASAMDDTSLVASLLGEDADESAASRGGERPALRTPTPSSPSARADPAGGCSSSCGPTLAAAVEAATASAAEELVVACSPSAGPQPRRPSPPAPTRCRYAPDGCRATPAAPHALRHESECLFQDAECPLFGCAWGGLLRELAPHLREEHAAQTVRGREAVHQIAMRALRAQRKYVCVQEAVGRLYVVAIRCHGLLYFATLQSVPEESDLTEQGECDAPLPTGWLEACAAPRGGGGEAEGAGLGLAAGTPPAAAWQGPVLPVSHAPVALYALRQCLTVDPAVVGLVGVAALSLRATVAFVQSDSDSAAS